MKSSLPPLPQKRNKTAPTGKAVQHKPFQAGDQPGRNHPHVRKGSYLDEDSLDISKTYFQPSITVQPTPPNSQKPSFSPHPPTSRPSKKSDDAIGKMYQELQRAGRYGSRSLMMQSSQQLHPEVSQTRVTLEVASREEVAARDLAQGSTHSLAQRSDDVADNRSFGIGSLANQSNENFPQSDPEVACGIIKEGDL